MAIVLCVPTLEFDMVNVECSLANSHHIGFPLIYHVYDL